MLRHLKKVFIQFTPGDRGSVSARELLQRVSGDKAKKSNPACVVEFKVTDQPDAKPLVDLLFADGEQKKLVTTDLTIQDIAKLIENKGSEMELRGVMKEVGYDPWKQGNRVELPK